MGGFLVVPRQRVLAENQGLPKRWSFYHGAYYYSVPNGEESSWDCKKRFRLESNLEDAYGIWADRLKARIEVRRIEQLLDRYLLEVTPTKAKRTQADEPGYAAHLKRCFGHMRLQDIEPQHIYQYFDRRKDQTKDKEGNLAKSRQAKTQSRNELQMLSHAFTKAAEWGYIRAHPYKKEVRLDKERGQKARDRYIEDWVLTVA
jgi:hypothetical protein